MQVLCSELDILQTENFFFSVTKQKKTQKKTICKEVAKFKGKSSFLLSDFQFKVGYRDRVIAFLCFKAFFLLRIHTQFIVHRTIDYPQIIGLIKGPNY